VTTPPGIRAERLVFHYDGEIPALNGIDVEISDNAYSP